MSETTRRGSQTTSGRTGDLLEVEQRRVRKAIRETGYAVPFYRQNIWKNARRNAPDHFRMMRSVWRSPWFTSDDSALENFGSSLVKAGRLTWMSLGAVVAGATLVVQSITKPFSWAGKKLFEIAGRSAKSKNPFKWLGGVILCGLGGIICKAIDAPVKAACILSGVVVRTVFDGKLSSRYGIQSEQPIGAKVLQSAMNKIVNEKGKLARLADALQKTNFVERTQDISGIMREVLPESHGRNVYTDEAIGGFLGLAEKEINKIKEEQRQKSEKKPTQIEGNKHINREPVQRTDSPRILQI